LHYDNSTLERGESGGSSKRLKRTSCAVFSNSATISGKDYFGFAFKSPIMRASKFTPPIFFSGNAAPAIAANVCNMSIKETSLLQTKPLRANFYRTSD
jgi:hypothetical protein